MHTAEGMGLLISPLDMDIVCFTEVNHEIIIKALTKTRHQFKVLYKIDKYISFKKKLHNKTEISD